MLYEHSHEWVGSRCALCPALRPTATRPMRARNYATREHHGGVHTMGAALNLYMKAGWQMLKEARKERDLARAAVLETGGGLGGHNFPTASDLQVLWEIRREEWLRTAHLAHARAHELRTLCAIRKAGRTGDL